MKCAPQFFIRYLKDARKGKIGRDLLYLIGAYVVWLIYVISPYDLLPDEKFGWYGYLDDLGFTLLLFFYTVKVAYENDIKWAIMAHN